MIDKFYATKMALSLDKRYEIVFLHEHPKGPKWGYKKIASYVKCSRSAVTYWVQKYHKNKNLTDEQKSGRPRCTTEMEDKRISKMAKLKHDITSTEIQCELEKKGVEVSVQTIRRRLRESGGKFVKEISKPLLSEKHRTNRLT
jgi:transposase